MEITKFASIDQSYVECGIAVFNGTELIEVTRLNFHLLEKRIKQTQNRKYRMRNRDKRKILQQYIQRLYKDGVKVFVVERVRVFSRNTIAIQSIVALSELISTIIDAAPEALVISIDTRSWKSKTVGRANANKEMTIEWAEKEYMTEKLRKARGYRELTDNEADAIGLGVGYIKDCPIKEEE